VPDTGNAISEFCYVENAAAAHVAAVSQLLKGNGRCFRRVFNVTNGDMPRPSICVWNLLIEAVNEKAGRRVLEPLKTIHATALRAIALISQFIFWLFCGHVPARKHPFWNLTLASLSLSCTSITQDVSETRSCLEFEPLYDTEGSFDHMLHDWLPPQELVQDPLRCVIS